MKTRGFTILFLCSLILGASQVSFAACDQTLSQGANVASAASTAAPGTTICLNSGNYGSVNLTNIVKTSDIILQSVSGRVATINLTISGSNHLKFQSLTISGLTATSNTTRNITIAGNTFTGQAFFNMGTITTPLNILIDGNSFDNITVCATCPEGRLQIQSDGPNIGMTITNNHFGGPGDSDGIQTGANGVVIGPGNVFDGLIYTGNRHVDAIQFDGTYGVNITITGNYFINGGSYIMAPDGGLNERIINNVFVVGDYYPAIQLGSNDGDVVRHNTFIGIGVNLDNKTGNPASSNGLVQDNIFLDGSMHLNCTNCTIAHNLFNVSGNAVGTNNIIGTPTFVGGAKPADLVGYQLTSSSVGYQAASDGTDMGSNFFGHDTPNLPATPTNLLVE